MFGVRIARIVSSFSLLLLALFAFATDYQALARRIEGEKDVVAVAKIIEAACPNLDTNDPLYIAIIDIRYGDGESYTANKLKKMVGLRAASEMPPDVDAKAQIKAIKSSPLYRDAGVQDESNWLDGAIQRLLNLIPKPSSKGPAKIPAIGASAGWLVPIVWGLLGAAVLIFGYFALRHFQWKRALRRKAKAMLEEDEPERTLDEWLEMADRFTAEGKFREAVRAMYLSCLLKFDEAGIARFVRGETNWEHLARIQASGKRPTEIDFLPPTRAFDRIWYGYHVRGLEDVEQFRNWYQEITRILGGAKT